MTGTFRHYWQHFTVGLLLTFLYQQLSHLIFVEILIEETQVQGQMSDQLVPT